MPEIPNKIDLGTILGRKTLMFREDCGTATLGEIRYELSTTTNGEMIIRSLKTYKWFLIKWSEVIDLAIKAGIDDADVTSVPSPVQEKSAQ